MSMPNDPNPFRSPDAEGQAPQRIPKPVLWWVLCVAAVIAMALLPFAPGLSLTIVVVLAPAFVHAHVRLVRRSQIGTLPSLRQQWGIVLGSLGICTLLAISVYVAGFVICISSDTVLSYITGNLSIHIVVALLLGILFPFALYWVLFAGTLGCFRRRTEHSESLSEEDNQEKPQ